MVWAPRCALLPLGSVRGDDGLTIWEHIAFADAVKNMYNSGDDENEEEADACFLFHEELAAQEEEAERNAWSEDEYFAWDEEADNSQGEQQADDNGRFDD